MFLINAKKKFFYHTVIRNYSVSNVCQPWLMQDISYVIINATKSGI